MTDPSPQSRRRWLSFAAGIAVSIACLASIFWRLDFAAIRGAFAAADYRALPLMIGVVYCLLWLNARRWTWLLRPLGSFTTKQTFPPLVVGFAMNNILPARLGELVRVHVFCREHRTPPLAVLAGVALERVFDVVAIVAFFVIGLISIPQVDPRVHQSAWLLGSLALAAFATAIAYVIWTERVTRIIDAVLRRTPLVSDNLRGRLLRWLTQGADGLGVLRNGPLVAWALVNTLLQWSLAGLQMYIALRSFGVSIPPSACCLLVAVVAVGVTVPSAPGYVGVIQALFLVVINEQTVGIKDASAVFGASVYYHMTQYILVTVGGLFYLNRMGLTLSETQQVAAEPVAAAPADSAPHDAPRRFAA